MNKKEAIDYLFKEIEKIEKENSVAKFDVESTKQKRLVVDKIMKVVKEVEIEDEN